MTTMTEPESKAPRRSWGPLAGLALVTAVSFAAAFGCAKQQIVKEEKKAEQAPAPAQAQQPQETPQEKLEEAMQLDAVHFDFDKSNIRPEDAKILKQHAHELKEGKYRHVKVTIEGYCDERGSDEYNMALGERRARSTFDYLHRLGVAKHRMKTISYGKEHPVDPGHDEAAWAKNRRCEFKPQQG